MTTASSRCAPRSAPDDRRRLPAPQPGRSPFAGADICRQAGLTLPDRAARPNFDDDLWDFTDVAGLPVSLTLAVRRFSFAQIADSRWRLVAKELIFAMLVPRHEAVAGLPRAFRTPMHITTASGRLQEISRFLELACRPGHPCPRRSRARHCEALLAHRRYVLDEHGTVVGERSPALRRGAAQAVIDLLNYGELFTADRPDPGLRPWGGATASAIAEMPSGRTRTKHRLSATTSCRPMLAAALYLTTVIGPHAVTLNNQVRDALRAWGRSGEQTFPSPSHAPVAEITRLLDRYLHENSPLPMLPRHWVSERLSSGWRPDDPLLPVGLNMLARQAGINRFSRRWLETNCGTPSRKPSPPSASRKYSPATGLLSTALTARARRPGPCPCTSPRPSPWPASSGPPPLP